MSDVEYKNERYALIPSSPPISYINCDNSNPLKKDLRSLESESGEKDVISSEKLLAFNKPLISESLKPNDLKNEIIAVFWDWNDFVPMFGI
jgi:hypothetical protein